jgi:endogenous inhibitor of DNA gyrase (YacG/DUF329 family)
MPDKPPSSAKPEKGAEKPCPTCRKPATAAFRPFCSARCRDVDLNRWLTGSYIIPAKDDDEDEE